VATVWSLEDGRSLREIAIGGRLKDRAAFSPDGRRLAVGDSDNTVGDGVTVRVFDLETGDRLVALADLIGVPHQVAFSPDGRRLATADHRGKSVKVWDVENGQELVALPGVVGVERLFFTPDGHHLVAAGPSGVLTFDGTPSPEP
jgi:WD40 repeat protein